MREPRSGSRTSFSRHLTRAALFLAIFLSRACGELFWLRGGGGGQELRRCDVTDSTHTLTQEVDLCRLLHRPLVNVSDALHPLGLTPRAVRTSTKPISGSDIFCRGSFGDTKLNFVCAKCFMSG
jgi:hypothetical protein